MLAENDEVFLNQQGPSTIEDCEIVDFPVEECLTSPLPSASLSPTASPTVPPITAPPPNQSLLIIIAISAGGAVIVLVLGGVLIVIVSLICRKKKSLGKALLSFSV